MQKTLSRLRLSRYGKGTKDAADHVEGVVEGPEVVIMVMGPTGSGKSTIINTIARRKRAFIGHGLSSATSTIQVVDTILDGRRIKLIDTPGFDDTNRTEAVVLKEIALFLQTTYESHITINGILWMHRISDVRFTGSAMRSLHLLQDLVGKGSLRNVRLVTTFWDQVTPEAAERRLIELQNEDAFWKLLIEHGSEVHKHDKGDKSAHIIIKSILKNERSVLEIQRELVDQHKALWQTAAGIRVHSGLSDRKESIGKQLSDLQAELHKAEASPSNDLAWLKGLEECRDDMRAALESISKDMTLFNNYPLELRQWTERLEDASRERQLDRRQLIWSMYSDADIVSRVIDGNLSAESV